MPGIHSIRFYGVSLIKTKNPTAMFLNISATISRESPYLAQLDGLGLMQVLEEQQRWGVIARQKEDLIRQTASSSE